MNDGTAQTYTYQLQNASADLTSFVNTANAQGRAATATKGRSRTAISIARTAARRPPTRTTTGLPTDANAFLTQANGQSGYWFLGPIVVASVQANIYMKNNASSATYTYDALAPASTVSDFIAQANSEGAKGYRAKGAMAFGTAISWVYVKDQTQSPTFSYQSAAIQSTGASFVQQSNTFGGWQRVPERHGARHHAAARDGVVLFQPEELHGLPARR